MSYFAVLALLGDRHSGDYCLSIYIFWANVPAGV